MRKVLFIMIFGSLLFSCGERDKERKTGTASRLPMAWGHPQTVYVFVDDNIWTYAERPLRESLERFYFTTENENYFEIKKAEYNNLEQFYRFNNLIFYADYASTGKVSEYVRGILGDEIAGKIGEEKVGIYPRNNLWANDQLVVFILGNNEENLLKLNILQSNDLFNLYRDKLYERLGRKVYKQQVYSDRQFNGLPWKMQLTRNYLLYKEDRQNNFISFLARLKNHPDRYLAIQYEKIPRQEFSKDWLIKRRAELAWKYYDEDEFKDADIRLEKTTLGSYSGWKLSGRWQNYKYSVGGAFQSFAIYDEDDGYAYIIDNSVYFPEGYKLTALLEMEIISRSFEIKPQ